MFNTSPMSLAPSPQTHFGFDVFGRANVASSFLHLRGRALLLLGRFDEAEAALNEVLELYRQQGVRTGLWRVHLTLGELFRAKAELARADAAFAQTRTIIEELTASLADDTLREAFRRQAMATIPLA